MRRRVAGQGRFGVRARGRQLVGKSPLARRGRGRGHRRVGPPPLQFLLGRAERRAARARRDAPGDAAEEARGVFEAPAFQRREFPLHRPQLVPELPLRPLRGLALAALRLVELLGARRDVLGVREHGLDDPGVGLGRLPRRIQLALGRAAPPPLGAQLLSRLRRERPLRRQALEIRLGLGA